MGDGGQGESVVHFGIPMEVLSLKQVLHAVSKLQKGAVAQDMEPSVPLTSGWKGWTVFCKADFEASFLNIPRGKVLGAFKAMEDAIRRFSVCTATRPCWISVKTRRQRSMDEVLGLEKSVNWCSLRERGKSSWLSVTSRPRRMEHWHSYDFSCDSAISGPRF